MKFRIKKEDGLYFAEYKYMGFWRFISGSVSSDIEKSKEACKRFEMTRVVERFKLTRPKEQNMKIFKYHDYRKIVPDKDDELVDKIVSFFENEDNWKALKSCCLEDNGYNNFRKLLYTAIND